MLNRFFHHVDRCATAQGGWANKFEGDGALCVFGAPVGQAGHAARALRAARALHDRLIADGIEAGIGVATGEVVAGNIGAEHRFEYTVIGRPVNEAARLTDAAKQRPARVLATVATVRAAPDEAGRWRECGALRVAGRGGARAGGRTRRPATGPAVAAGGRRPSVRRCRGGWRGRPAARAGRPRR